MQSVRGLSSHWLANHVVEVVDAHGESHEFVLRRWARPGWADEDPDYTAAHEAIVLELLASSPVPAPGVVAVDPEGDWCDVPALLLTLLPGHPPPDSDLSAMVADLAAALPVIHAVNTGGAVRGYARYYELDRLKPPMWSRRPDLWEQAIDIAGEAPPAGPIVFIHRDYHPGNTLWSRGRLTGVVDWTGASVGPPPVDVGHMRWNLAGMHSLQAADEFLEAYRAVAHEPASVSDQAYWDVVMAVDVLPELEVGRDPDAGLLRIEEHVAAAVKRAS